MKKIVIFLFLFFFSIVNAQIVNPNSGRSEKKNVPKKTSIEIQAIQTRTFETSEKNYLEPH